MGTIATCLIVSAATALGQSERVTIACAGGPASSLMLIGASDLLSGQRPIELPPGIGFLRSLFVRESLAMETATDDDAAGSFCRLRGAHLVAIERMSAAGDDCCIEPW